MPGLGLEARSAASVYRLGRPEWALPAGERRPDRASCCPGRRLLCRFAFEDELRAGAREAVAALMAKGLPVEILSGDQAEPVRALASSLDVPCRGRRAAGGKVDAHRRARRQRAARC